MKIPQFLNIARGSIDSFYLEAVSVYYEIGSQSEVEGIIKTIQSN